MTARLKARLPRHHASAHPLRPPAAHRADAHFKHVFIDGMEAHGLALPHVQRDATVDRLLPEQGHSQENT